MGYKSLNNGFKISRKTTFRFFSESKTLIIRIKELSLLYYLLILIALLLSKYLEEQYILVEPTLI